MYRNGTVTRNRILEAREQFRDSLKNDTAPQSAVSALNPAAVSPPAQQPAQPAQPVPQAAAAAQMVPPSNIPVPDSFIQTVDKLGQLQETAAPSQQPQEDPELKSAQEENAKLQKELEELRKARENDAQSLQELQQLRDKKQIDDYLAGMSDLGSINPDDARKLISPLLKRLDNVQLENQKKLQEAQSAVDKRLAELDKRNNVNRSNQIYSQIMKAHPDLQELQKSKAYQDVMLSPVQPGSAITVGELVTAELRNGNADYVIKVLDTVKQRNTVPNINQIASVGASSSVAGATGGVDNSGDRLTPEQISDLRYKVQIGEMSRDEFRQIMARHREASKLH